MTGMIGKSSLLSVPFTDISAGGNWTAGFPVQEVCDHTLKGVGPEAGGVGFGHLFLGFISLSLSGVLSS